MEATFEAQQHVTQELAEELSQFLLDTPSEFTSLRYNARYAGTFSQSTIMGVRADGSEGWKGIPRMTSTLGDLTDQKVFPRDAEHTPEWLARKVDEGLRNPPPSTA